MKDSQRMQAFCLLILTCLACAAAAYWLKSVLLPFVFAAFISLTLRPLVSILHRKLHCPKVLAILITLALSGFLLVALTAVVSSALVEISANVNTYEQRFTVLIDKICVHPWLERFHFKRMDIISSIGTKVANSLGQALATIFNALFSLLSNIVIVSIYLIFLMFGTPLDDAPTGQTTLFKDIRSRIEYYVLVKALLSFIVGVLTWLILNLLGVPMSYAFGLLAFALNFIPNVGPIVSVILPLPVAMLDPNLTLATFSLVVILPTFVHLLVGYLVEPNILGDSLELSPIVILLTLILGGVLWGPVGMLLATPITVACQMITDRIGWAKPVASLLSGRMPGTAKQSKVEPVESDKIAQAEQKKEATTPHETTQEKPDKA